MGFTVQVKWEGLKPWLDRLKNVDKSLRKKIVKQAVNEAGRLTLQYAKQNIRSQRTGMLRKSLGRKIKVYRQSGIVVAIVGPRSGYAKVRSGGRKLTAFGKKSQALKVDPAKYAHLVEKGRASVQVKDKRVLSDLLSSGGRSNRIYGKRVSAAAPRPFLRTALEQHHAEIMEAMRTIIAAGIRAAYRSTMGA
jgi:HK97 gp10 family phage protein